MVWIGPIILFVLAAFLTITGVLLLTVIPRMIRRKQQRWEDQRELADPELLVHARRDDADRVGP
jgi:hypothetical protein